MFITSCDFNGNLSNYIQIYVHNKHNPLKKQHTHMQYGVICVIFVRYIDARDFKHS